MSSSTPPAPRIIIKSIQGDEERDVFMSFALLNQLASLVGSVERVPEISFNGEIRSRAVDLVLAERDERGRITPSDAWDLDLDSGCQLLDWIEEHLFDFFLRRLKDQLRRVEKRTPELQAVGSSLTGSAGSPSSMASSSPSA